jgi:hypothetical protein
VLVALVTEVDNCIDFPDEDCRLRILVLSASSSILLHVDATEEGIKLAGSVCLAAKYQVLAIVILEYGSSHRSPRRLIVVIQ